VTSIVPQSFLLPDHRWQFQKRDVDITDEDAVRALHAGARPQRHRRPHGRSEGGGWACRVPERRTCR
jgi:hypothetical protein